MEKFPELRRSEIRGPILSDGGKWIATVALILLAITSVFFYNWYSDYCHSRDYFGMWTTEMVQPNDSFEAIVTRAALPGTTVIPERTYYIPNGIDMNEDFDKIIRKSIALRKLDRKLQPGDQLLVYMEIPRKDLPK